MIGEGNGDFGDFYVSLYGRWWGVTDDGYRIVMDILDGGWKKMVVGRCTSFCFMLYGNLERIYGGI